MLNEQVASESNKAQSPESLGRNQDTQSIQLVLAMWDREVGSERKEIPESADVISPRCVLIMQSLLVTTSRYPGLKALYTKYQNLCKK